MQSSHSSRGRSLNSRKHRHPQNSNPGPRGRRAYVIKPQSSRLSSELLATPGSCTSNPVEFVDDKGGKVAVNEDSGENSRNHERREVDADVADLSLRLAQLDAREKEPELEDELLNLNDQKQEYELLALESIYGDNAIMINRRGLRSIQIHIHIETEGAFTIAAQLNTSVHLDSTWGNIDDTFSYSFEVQHLPPIVLTLLLPKSYPSHLPPYFTIYVQWLDHVRISHLCSMLDSIWTEQQGQEIMYQWAEWLQSSSLSCLGFHQEIVLNPPYGVIGATDKRAISGSVSFNVDIPSMRRYNDDKCHEKFLRSVHECFICFSEYAGTDFIRLPCQHFFCLKCMKTYSNLHVKEGTVNMLKCPDAKCRGAVPPSLLKQLLDDEAYQQWESLILQKTLDSMTDVVYCPRCETPCIEDPDQHAVCSRCLFSFCTLCRDRRHVGIECMTPEIRLQILQDRQSSSRLREDQKLKERELINELLSVQEILRDAKQCPSCKIAISRSEGCNKMVCNNCGQKFCYRCNKEISGYEHFRDGECELFPEEEIRNWEGMMRNPRQALGEIQANLFPDHGNQCPSCRQYNAKVGNNNHLCCWACQTHFCYLCKKVVRRASQHYGPKGCKQHTT
ncbi:hypothetical protein SAY87_013979 [Trapa incisa]|uniref:RBR-type E3 ubiquitin transferase n=1 Tax=Trapa incisa TaxID=236973 RepID=A0AAN7GUW5_9MYRT|nr:hypothetical protein SAY87_013979 [Trapa incisa]